MRIVFRANLGNTGGSRTVIRCAEAFSLLGHESIISVGANKYTWHKPKGVSIISGRIPRCDIAIATGCDTVENVATCKAERKMYYIRGFETWKAPKEYLFQTYRRLGCVVNSKWLRDLLQSKGIKCELIYPGLDYEWFFDRGDPRKDLIGGIFHKFHKTKRHIDTIKIAETLKLPLTLMNRDIKNSSPQKLNKWYNAIKVWVGPARLEGLHNPPMEAGLCGCSLVCANSPHGGMSDYAIHNETAMIYDPDDVDQASLYVKELLENNDLRTTLNKNLVLLLKRKMGNRTDNMKKFIKHSMGEK